MYATEVCFILRVRIGGLGLKLDIYIFVLLFENFEPFHFQLYASLENCTWIRLFYHPYPRWMVLYENGCRQFVSGYMYFGKIETRTRKKACIQSCIVEMVETTSNKKISTFTFLHFTLSSKRTFYGKKNIIESYLLT